MKLTLCLQCSVPTGRKTLFRAVDWEVVPRIGDSVELMDGWSSELVTQVDFDCKGRICVTIRAVRFEQKNVDKLMSEGGWSDSVP